MNLNYHSSLARYCEPDYRPAHSPAEKSLHRKGGIASRRLVPVASWSTWMRTSRLVSSVYFHPSARYRSERTRRYEYTYDFSSSAIVMPVIELTPVVSDGLRTFQGCLSPVATRRRET